MTKLYFDNTKGIVLIDGKKSTSPALTDENFAVEFFPYDSDCLPVQHALSKKTSSCKDMLCIKHGKDTIIKFLPQRKPVFEEAYIIKQAECNQVKHLLTCKADRCHVAVIETQEEIITLPLPARPDKVSFKAKRFCDGQLLIVKAHTGKKTYIAVLHYNDDYTLLMSAYCDKAQIADDGRIILRDKLYDCMQRTCVRTLKFCNNAFVEEFRYFEYECERDFPDELIPYVFLESISCNDDDAIKKIVSYSLREENFHEIFGNFIGICDTVEYVPYKVTLVYADKGFYTKSFCFSLSGGRINFVNCV